MDRSVSALPLEQALSEEAGSEALRIGTWLADNVELHIGSSVVGLIEPDDLEAQATHDDERESTSWIYVLARGPGEQLLWVMPRAVFFRIYDFSPLDQGAALQVPTGWQTLLARVLPSSRTPGPGWHRKVRGEDRRVQPPRDAPVCASAVAEAFQALLESGARCTALLAGDANAPPPDAWRLESAGDISISFQPPLLTAGPRLALAALAGLLIFSLAGGLSLLVRLTVDRDGDGYWSTTFGGGDCVDEGVEEGVGPDGQTVQVHPEDRNPSRLETCNGVDDNCDDHLDALDPRYRGPYHGWFADHDGDRHGSGEALRFTCRSDQQVAGQVMDLVDDCNDVLVEGGAEAFPGATEKPNGTDDDCDGVIDNGFAAASPNRQLTEAEREARDRSARAKEQQRRLNKEREKRETAPPSTEPSPPPAPVDPRQPCGDSQSKLGSLARTLPTSVFEGFTTSTVRFPPDQRVCQRISLVTMSGASRPTQTISSRADLEQVAVQVELASCSAVSGSIPLALTNADKSETRCTLHLEACALRSIDCE